LGRIGTRSILYWSHFLRRTGAHFAGQCSNPAINAQFRLARHYSMWARVYALAIPEAIAAADFANFAAPQALLENRIDARAIVRS
jgi:hypothetical protein